MTSPGAERGEVSDPPPPVTVASTVKVERIDRTKVPSLLCSCADRSLRASLREWNMVGHSSASTNHVLYEVQGLCCMQRCPLLLRMFAKTGGHNRVSEYRQNQFPDNELSIHTWMDADLRELADLVKQTQSSARGKDATMEFSLVYPDKRGINVMKPVRSPPHLHLLLRLHWPPAA